MRLGKRHQNQAIVAKANHLGRDARGAGGTALRVQMAVLAHRQSQTLDFDAEADHLDDAALEAQG
jgi:hypothetical protein